MPPRLALPSLGQSASQRDWVLRAADEHAAAQIAHVAGISLTLARVLEGRGVTPGGVGAYLAPSLRDAMPDPFVLTDMEAATERLARAVTSGETVGVFGDYDVDGTSAAAILKLYFRSVGAPLIVYLPDRMLEGYGPTVAAFEALRARGASLIVTVDCGAAAYEPIAAARALGVDVVVIDHHLMQGPPPPGAVAVVNPNRPDDRSNLGNLSAAGVAFMAVVALNRRLRQLGFFERKAEPDPRGLLDLAALGLVCDVMALTGFTRVLVSQGLKVLGAGAAGPGNAGLQALLLQAGAKGGAGVSAYDLGFVLGPRINAAGRIGHAELAFDLLTTDDPVRRARAAERLHLLNAERQAIEAGVQASAIVHIESRGLHHKPVMVVAGEGWHPGVIGVVAGRLKDRYDRPVVVIGLGAPDDDASVGKGSGRSIGGVDLGAAIVAAKARGLLIAGGGHAMAAGLTIAPTQVAAFTDYLEQELAASVAVALATRVREIDAVVAPGAVSRAFAAEIARGGPFGAGNPEPVFVVTDVAVVSMRLVGEAHLSCDLSAGSERLRAIAFRAAHEPLGAMLRHAHARGGRLALAGKIKADDWRGGDNAQLQIVDAAPMD